MSDATFSFLMRRVVPLVAWAMLSALWIMLANAVLVVLFSQPELDARAQIFAWATGCFGCWYGTAPPPQDEGKD